MCVCVCVVSPRHCVSTDLECVRAMSCVSKKNTQNRNDTVHYI